MCSSIFSLLFDGKKFRQRLISWKPPRQQGFLSISKNFVFLPYVGNTEEILTLPHEKNGEKIGPGRKTTKRSDLVKKCQKQVGIPAKHKSMTLISSSVTLTLIFFCSPKDLKIKTWQTSLKLIQYLYDRIDSGCKQDSKPNQYSQQHSRLGGLSLSQSRLSYTVSRILLCSH